jgi:hypothetical protein
MTDASEFRQYAEEALRWAEKSTTEKERLSLMELAHTWAQAANASERPMPAGVDDSPIDRAAAR